MDYKQETDGNDKSSSENLLRNASNTVQSIQKRRWLVIESSNESDANIDGGDKDIRADEMDNKDSEDEDSEDEDAVSIEDANNCLSDLPVLLKPILSNRH